MYVASFMHEGKSYLLSDEHGQVVVWETEKKFRKSFVKMYRNITRTKGAGWALSHSLYFSFFSHYVYDMDVLEKEVTTEDHRLEACKSILGTCVGILCAGEKAASWRKSGNPLNLDLVSPTLGQPN